MTYIAFCAKTSQFFVWIKIFVRFLYPNFLQALYLYYYYYYIYIIIIITFILLLLHLYYYYYIYIIIIITFILLLLHLYYYYYIYILTNMFHFSTLVFFVPSFYSIWELHNIIILWVVIHYVVYVDVQYCNSPNHIGNWLSTSSTLVWLSFKNKCKQQTIITVTVIAVTVITVTVITVTVITVTVKGSAGPWRSNLCLPMSWIFLHCK